MYHTNHKHCTWKDHNPMSGKHFGFASRADAFIYLVIFPLVVGLVLALCTHTSRASAQDTELHCQVTITLTCNADASVCTQNTITLCTRN